MNKWSGLFNKSISEKMHNFNASLAFDCKLAKYDIIGTIAHVNMLQKIGIITEEERKKTTQACEQLLADPIEIRDNEQAEDVHFFIQSKLQEKIGDLAKKIHTGRSRNDQISLDLRLYTKDQIEQIVVALEKIIASFLHTAKLHLYSVMPAYTHLQQAQPTSLAHYFCCYAECILEDIWRFKDTLKRVNRSPLGASSVCGSSVALDRNFVAEQLNFDGLMENSMNAVSNRDFIVEFCANSSILMMHLSRLCEDIIIYSSQEFGFFVLDDAFCTGSSLMPNKKNPDLLELIRGKTGSVFGNLTSILTILKSMPMSYNKDMQEDKLALFASAETLLACLDILGDFLPNLQFNTEKMASAVHNSYCLATDLLDYLVLRGIYFKDAHEIVASLTKYCLEQKKWFHQLKLNEFKQFCDIFADDLFDLLDLQKILSNHKTVGSPNPEMVKKFIENFYLKS